MTHQDGAGPRPVANPPRSWCAILPVRSFSVAKSRLGAELPDPPQLRAELARAFALDVLAAVASCPSVDCVLIVGDGGPELLSLLNETDDDLAAERVWAISAPAGLNLAVEHGEAWARERGHRRMAVIAADLPCLTAEDLRTVLVGAALTPRGFVIDEGRSGTTMLTTAGPSLRPTFGLHSARRHLASGAAPLPATAAARLDVDHLDALLRARDLGVGTATTAVLARHSIAPPNVADLGNDPAQHRAVQGS